MCGTQEERTGQRWGLRAAIQNPERHKVGRPNQRLRGQQRGRVGDSESRGWLWLLVPDGSGNLLRPWLPTGASLHLQSQEECWSGQVSLMPVTKEVVWEKGLCQRGAGVRVQGSD